MEFVLEVFKLVKILPQSIYYGPGHFRKQKGETSNTIMLIWFKILRIISFNKMIISYHDLLWNHFLTSLLLIEEIKYKSENSLY